MSELIYIDTNVYIDYFLNRKDKFRPLGDFAFELLRKSLDCKYTIIISKWVLDELGFFISEKEITELIQWMESKEKVIFIMTSKEDVLEAKKKAHWQDALHAILAKKANANYLVTRNIKDYSNFSDVLNIVLPENL